MNSENRVSDGERLEARLRKEAQTRSPRYSVALHERIMQQVGSETTMRSATPITVRGNDEWRFLTTAAAAAIIVLIPAGLWWASSRTKLEHTPLPTVVVLPLPPFDTALASALQPAGEQLGQGRFGYLDEDAQRFTQFVADQFDVLPTSRQ